MPLLFQEGGQGLPVPPRSARMSQEAGAFRPAPGLQPGPGCLRMRSLRSRPAPRPRRRGCSRPARGPAGGRRPEPWPGSAAPRPPPDRSRPTDGRRRRRPWGSAPPAGRGPTGARGAGRRRAGAPPPPGGRPSLRRRGSIRGAPARPEPPPGSAGAGSRHPAGRGAACTRPRRQRPGRQLDRPRVSPGPSTARSGPGRRDRSRSPGGRRRRRPPRRRAAGSAGAGWKGASRAVPGGPGAGAGWPWRAASRRRSGRGDQPRRRPGCPRGCRRAGAPFRGRGWSAPPSPRPPPTRAGRGPS